MLLADSSRVTNPRSLCLADPLNEFANAVKTDSKTGGQQWISVDEGRNSIGLWSGWKTLVDGGKRVVPKGGLDMRCALVFALVLLVLETSMFCPLRVLYVR